MSCIESTAGLNGLIYTVVLFQLISEMEFDLDKALEDVPVHVEDACSRTPPTPSQVQPKLEQRLTGAMAELPSEEEKKLQHFTKLRPRRSKKMHSSKVPVSRSSQQEEVWSFTDKIDFNKHDCGEHKLTLQQIDTNKETVDLKSSWGLGIISHCSTSCFSKSAVLHLRTESRMASWEGWMRA